MVKKLKRVEVEEKLKSMGLEVFTPREFSGIFGVPQNIASVFISRNLIDGGIFIKIRNGLYALKDAYTTGFFLANRIYEPSYISFRCVHTYVLH